MKFRLNAVFVFCLILVVLITAGCAQSGKVNDGTESETLDTGADTSDRALIDGCWTFMLGRSSGVFEGETISLYEDGEYSYSPSVTSSYMNVGTWSLDNGILLLSPFDDSESVYRFRFSETELQFIKDGSGSADFVNVRDGDVFSRLQFGAGSADGNI